MHPLPNQDGVTPRTDLVLPLGLEIAGVMALVQLPFGQPNGAFDHSPALDRRALADFFRPALNGERYHIETTVSISQN
jgi:hypothetical protein